MSPSVPEPDAPPSVRAVVRPENRIVPDPPMRHDRRMNTDWNNSDATFIPMLSNKPVEDTRRYRAGRRTGNVLPKGHI